MTEERRKRINRLKKIIVILAVVFLLIPSCLSVIVLIKLSSISKEYRALSERVDALSKSYEIVTKAYENLEINGFENSGQSYYIETEIQEEDNQTVEGSENDNLDNDNSENGNPDNDKSENDNAENGNLENDNPENGNLENDNPENDNPDNDKSENDNSENDNLNEEMLINQMDVIDVDMKSSDNTASGAKRVYLTFDDGPGTHCEEILDILAEYNVKATFFCIGKTSATADRCYTRIVSEGHTLAMHSYSHKYASIYTSIEGFEEDYNAISSLLAGYIGEAPKYYRFPGGSSNSVSELSMTVFAEYLDEKNITYFDWNVMSGDAVKNPPTAQEIYDNVISGVEKRDYSVVLFHDLPGKETTVEALPSIISRLLEDGYEILAIDEQTEEVHHHISH